MNKLSSRLSTKHFAHISNHQMQVLFKFFTWFVSLLTLKHIFVHTCEKNEFWCSTNCVEALTWLSWLLGHFKQVDTIVVISLKVNILVLLDYSNNIRVMIIQIILKYWWVFNLKNLFKEIITFNLDVFIKTHEIRINNSDLDVFKVILHA